MRKCVIKHQIKILRADVNIDYRCCISCPCSFCHSQIYWWIPFVSSKFLLTYIYCVVVVWPEGTYGLPKPVTGCPPNWQEGWRNQDLENTNPSSEFSVGLTSRMDATLTGGDIRRGFCVKTATQIGETSWPAGKK